MDDVLTDNDIVNCEMSNTVNNVTSDTITEDVLLTEDHIVNCETINTVNNVPITTKNVLMDNYIVNCEISNTVNNVVTSDMITEDVLLTDYNIVNCETFNTVNNVPITTKDVFTNNDIVNGRGPGGTCCGRRRPRTSRRPTSRPFARSHLRCSGQILDSESC